MTDILRDKPGQQGRTVVILPSDAHCGLTRAAVHALYLAADFEPCTGGSEYPIFDYLWDHKPFRRRKNNTERGPDRRRNGAYISGVPGAVMLAMLDTAMQSPGKSFMPAGIFLAAVQRGNGALTRRAGTCLHALIEMDKIRQLAPQYWADYGNMRTGWRFYEFR